MPPRNILVIGSGELGTPVLQHLAAHSRRDGAVSVMLRSPPKRSYVVSGISVVTGDISNASEDELSALFAPFHTVIGCTGMTCPPGTQVKVARAILKANIARYFPWQFGVDYDIVGPSSSQNLFTEQLEVRALLRSQSATRWVIVSTGMFTSFLFEPDFGVVSADRKTVRALGSWENRVTVTAPDDIGKVVAELVWGAPDVDGVVYTAGDTITYRRLAETVERVLGEEVTKEEWGVDLLKAQLAEDPENGTKKYRVVFAEGTGMAWDVEKTFNAQRDLRLETVEEWARNNLSK